MSQALWYVSRATGMVSLLLLTATMVLGLLTSGRVASRRWPRFTVSALHRSISLLTVVFLAVHIITAIVDTYAGIGWLDIVIPFASVYEPFWLGLGAVALDLMIAVVVTSLLRARLTHRVWRIVHLTSYALWPLVMVHGLGIGGSDSHRLWVQAIYVAAAAAVAGAAVYRVLASHPDTAERSVDAGTWR
jgi:methionine sulfoxide reductase heme-binding subunit